MEPDKHTKETLRYDFSDAELTQIARDLGQKCQDRETLEEEKKRVAQQYKLRIDTISGEIEADYMKVNSGYEMRDVDCAVFYHRPENGSKTVVRTDTGKIIRTERMTQMECQATMEFDQAEEGRDPQTKQLEGEVVEVEDFTEDPEEDGYESEWTDAGDRMPDSEVAVVIETEEDEEFTGSIVNDEEWSEDVFVSDEGEKIGLPIITRWRNLTAAEISKREGADTAADVDSGPTSGKIYTRSDVDPCQARDESGKIKASATSSEEAAATALVKKMHPDAEIERLFTEEETIRFQSREDAPAWMVWHYSVRTKSVA